MLYSGSGVFQGFHTRRSMFTPWWNYPSIYHPNQIRAESVTRTTANHSAAGDETEIPAALFGQAVHRLCETRPPKSEWQAFVTQVFEEEHPLGAGSEPPELTDDVFADIATAAERAVSYLDELHATSDPVAVYDEFQITLSMPHGELQGYIDHLIVTENAYHVVDYKTDRSSEKESVVEFLTRRAEHHEPQVMADAAALQREDPDRSVSVTLFFTDVNES